jgi:hypothetical protein
VLAPPPDLLGLGVGFGVAVEAVVVAAGADGAALVTVVALPAVTVPLAIGEQFQRSDD